ncbi:hypothetical protein BDS110ZK12_63830 [Bradyrhizobium diazoefficiens]|uniref:Uncharacterized protein n=1 Tax=Bradyrhizobium diazoefficiens TaxID=1355477 RepID=A0A810BIK0_9BRAD|nr:hypothetical protein XF8B_58100 [Bradyrhizobium diazoefficiens]
MNEVKDVRNESRLRAVNASRAACWAEILAGKSTSQNIAFWQLLDPSDITEVHYIRKASGQHQTGDGIVFSNNLHTVPCSLQAQF